MAMISTERSDSAGREFIPAADRATRSTRGILFSIASVTLMVTAAMLLGCAANVSTAVATREAPAPSVARRVLAVTTIAGASGRPPSIDGPVAQASLHYPMGLAVDASGNVWFTDDQSTLRKLTPDGRVMIVAGKPGATGRTDGPGLVARFADPHGVAVDRGGSVVVADRGNSGLRRVTADGMVTTLTRADGSQRWVDGPASTAGFAHPEALAFDRNGTLYISDSDHNAIRVLDTRGGVRTLAGRVQQGGDHLFGSGDVDFRVPSALAVDREGNVYLVSVNAIWRIDPRGRAEIYAGQRGALGGSTDGDRRSALFSRPTGLAVDTDGTLYVADTGNSRIRAIDPAGEVRTVAGTTSGVLDGDGATALFATPAALAFDGNGNLLVAESSRGLIRRITFVR